MATDQLYLRLPQIIGDRKRDVKPLIPVSAATWWRGCAKGIYPQPIKISARCTAWRAEEVMALAAKLDLSQAGVQK